MHKPVAFFESTVQDEMQVRVHQGESQDDHVVALHDDKDAVHPRDEILVVLEQRIDSIPVRGEMPAVLDLDFLSLDERDVEPEIGFDLREQFLIQLHLRIRRR